MLQDDNYEISWAHAEFPVTRGIAGAAREQFSETDPLLGARFDERAEKRTGATRRNVSQPGRNVIRNRHLSIRPRNAGGPVQTAPERLS